jgi:hypothetical protein
VRREADTVPGLMSDFGDVRLVFMVPSFRVFFLYCLVFKPAFNVGLKTEQSSDRPKAKKVCSCDSHRKKRGLETGG